MKELMNMLMMSLVIMHLLILFKKDSKEFG